MVETQSRTDSRIFIDLPQILQNYKLFLNRRFADKNLIISIRIGTFKHFAVKCNVGYIQLFEIIGNSRHISTVGINRIEFTGVFSNNLTRKGIGTAFYITWQIVISYNGCSVREILLVFRIRKIRFLAPCYIAVVVIPLKIIVPTRDSVCAAHHFVSMNIRRNVAHLAFHKGAFFRNDKQVFVIIPRVYGL